MNQFIDQACKERIEEMETTFALGFGVTGMVYEEDHPCLKFFDKFAQELQEYASIGGASKEEISKLDSYGSDYPTSLEEAKKLRRKISNELWTLGFEKWLLKKGYNQIDVSTFLSRVYIRDIDVNGNPYED